MVMEKYLVKGRAANRTPSQVVVDVHSQIIQGRPTEYWAKHELYGSSNLMPSIVAAVTDLLVSTGWSGVEVVGKADDLITMEPTEDFASMLVAALGAEAVEIAPGIMAIAVDLGGQDGMETDRVKADSREPRRTTLDWQDMLDALDVMIDATVGLAPTTIPYHKRADGGYDTVKHHQMFWLRSAVVEEVMREVSAGYGRRAPQHDAIMEARALCLAACNTVAGNAPHLAADIAKAARTLLAATTPSRPH